MLPIGPHNIGLLTEGMWQRTGQERETARRCTAQHTRNTGDGTGTKKDDGVWLYLTSTSRNGGCGRSAALCRTKKRVLTRLWSQACRCTSLSRPRSGHCDLSVPGTRASSLAGGDSRISCHYPCDFSTGCASEESSCKVLFCSFVISSEINVWSAGRIWRFP